MSKNKRSAWPTVIAVVVLFLLLGACSDSDVTSDDISANVVADDSDDSESGGDPTTTTTAATSGDDSGTASGNSSGLESVWPLPPGEATALLAYTDTSDEFSLRQTATFEMTGVDVETAISFYEDYFAGTDYEVGPRLPLGESIALNISMPDNPNITAVVHAGVQANGKLTLNQERSEFLEALDSDDSGAGSASGDASGSASDDGSGGADDSGSTSSLVFDGTTANVDWAGVSDVYLPNTGPVDDPYFHIHSDNEADGFYLSFELYTVWGQGWSGETGTFEISCSDPDTDTGICVHFDPDGAGPLGDVGADFAATGSVTINQLDNAGYSILVTGLTFSDGTVVADFELLG